MCFSKILVYAKSLEHPGVIGLRILKFESKNAVITLLWVSQDFTSANLSSLKVSGLQIFAHIIFSCFCSPPRVKRCATFAFPFSRSLRSLKGANSGPPSSSSCVFHACNFFSLTVRGLKILPHIIASCFFPLSRVERCATVAFVFSRSLRSFRGVNLGPPSFSSRVFYAFESFQFNSAWVRNSHPYIFCFFVCLFPFPPV